MILRATARRLFSTDQRYRQKTKLETSKIPYAVNRSGSGNLPVYQKLRGIEREAVTCIGSVYGDTTSFISDIRMAVCGNDCAINESGRSVVIQGRFARPLKRWLQSLGF